ncbi:hypothetical protein [Chitinophaga niabensis]|uniref:Uncharacterized protein n=1 Tax=Chitinophaga niabensis TaxID=536979 RepID=A0A1N6E528_9BACT|nr:hypothetical protein [Chitinophaga niabensis]SIN78027.1 hypothetical protein SAMN04488055_1303 [Chitinophaga niabensis]
MKDYRKETEGELMRLWNRLGKSGFRFIKLQFDFFTETESNATLQFILSEVKNHMEAQGRFNANGTLRDTADLFPFCLYAPLPKVRPTNVTTFVDFKLDYSPEHRFHVSELVVKKEYDDYEFTEIKVRIKPGEIPTTRQLALLTDKADKERIRKKEKMATTTVNASDVKMKLKRRM